MAKIIDFNPIKKVDKKVIEHLIKELKSIKPELVDSLFVHIGLLGEDGQRSTYTMTRGLDFYDIGYLDSYIQYLKIDILESHFISDPDSTEEEVKDLIDKYRKDTPDEDDE